MVRRFLQSALAATLLLGGVFGHAYAADDCFEVSETVKRLDTKDGLIEIRNATRQHLRTFSRKGDSYEGQYDIACLIGLYMTFSGTDSVEVTSEEALSRYEEVSGWFDQRFKGDSAERARKVALYKENPDLVDQEREEGFSQSEFVLWSIAGDVDNAMRSIAPITYPRGSLLDAVWCDAPRKNKSELEAFLSNLPKRMESEGWQVVARSEYEATASSYPAAGQGLESLCEGNVVTQNDFKNIRSRFKSVAEGEVKRAWGKVVNDGGAVDKKKWDAISWLSLACDRPPKKEEYETLDYLRYFKRSPASDWAAPAQDSQRKSAEYLILGKLEKDLSRFRGDGCFKAVAGEIAQLRAQSETWGKSYKNLLSRDFGSIWFPSTGSAEAAKRLRDHSRHVSEITRIRENCLTPSKNDKAAVATIQEFVARASNDTFIQVNTANLLIDAGKNEAALAEKVQQCRQISQLVELQKELNAKQKKYESWARNKSASVWKAVSEGKEASDLELVIGQVLPSVLPSAKDKEAIHFLFGFEKSYTLELQEQIMLLESNLRNRREDSPVFATILNEIQNKRLEFENIILAKWKDVLGVQSCEDIATELAEAPVLASLSPQCANPLAADRAILVEYCKLERLQVGLSMKSNLQDDRDDGRSFNLPTLPPSILDLNEAILVAQSGRSYASMQIIEDLYLVDPLSDEVQKAGFREAESLRAALLVLQRNGPVQQLFEQKLGGCSKSRYDQERETLFDLREWYIGKYDALCEDDGSNEARDACKVANDLDRKARPSRSSGSNTSGKFFEITFRSDVRDDQVSVQIGMDEPKIMPTGPRAYDRAESGDIVSIQWWADSSSPEPAIAFSFKCCDTATIKRESGGRVTVEKKTRNAIEIRFNSNATADPDQRPRVEVSEFSLEECKIYTPIVYDDSGDELGSYDIPLDGLTFEIDPGVYIKHPDGWTASLGEKFGAKLFVAAIGPDFILFLPRDSRTSKTLKEALDGNSEQHLNVRIALKETKVQCRIRQ